MRAAVFFSVLICSGCSVSAYQPVAEYPGTTADTMEIIRSAAQSAPKGVKGEYLLRIKATGKQGALLYLNTETDYRDQRNVTVALSSNVIAQLKTLYDVTPEQFFTGKKIRVKGDAQRVRIDFMNAEHKPSGKYYFQTHIDVSHISQIELVDERS